MSGCLQINWRDSSGTWTRTALIAWQTAHYTVQHAYHHNQKRSHSRAIYATRFWSAAAKGYKNAEGLVQNSTHN